MLENPYRPPETEFAAEQAGAAAPRKRFRFRVVPATLCFVYGGVGFLALVMLAVVMTAQVVRAGSERFNFLPMSIAFAGLLACFSLVFGAGWLWLRGKWFRAMAAVIAGFGIGMAVQWAMQSSNGRIGRSRGFYDVFLKPKPAGGAPKVIDGRPGNASEVNPARMAR
jgi:hypothetical protein